MRWHVVWIGLTLGGCTGLVGLSPDVDYRVLIEAVVDQCDQPTHIAAPPATAMEVGFAKVQAACEAFFVEATRAQQNALATSRGLDAALIAATAIINPTTSVADAAKVITITTAGVILAKAIIDNYTSIYAFNTYLYKVREHVTSSMEDYMTKARSSPPANYCIAYTYVQKLAMLCSLAAMKANLDQQVAIKSEIKPTPTTVGAARPAGAPRVVRGFALVPSASGPPSISYTVRPTP